MPLFNFEPPANEDDVLLFSTTRASTPRRSSMCAQQYVRKVSGFNRPSQANQAAFEAAVDAVAAATTGLLAALQTKAPARSRAPHRPG